MAENPYDRVAADIFSGRYALGMRASISEVGDRNPDKEAEHQKRARSLGVPYESARAHPDAIDRQIRLKKVDWDNMARQAPRTAKFLSSTSNAAIAHDDIDILGKLEQGIKSFFGGIAKNLDRVLLDDEPTLRKFARAKQAYRSGDFSRRNLAQHSKAAVAQTAASVAGLAEAAMRTAGVDSMAKDAQRARTYWKQTAERIRPEYETRIGRDVMAAIDSVPATAVAVAGGIYSGSAKAGAALLGALTAGGSYGEAIDADASNARALLYGLIDGSIETATELWPLKGLLGDLTEGSGPAAVIVHNLMKETVGEQAATLGQDYNASGRGHSGSSGESRLRNVRGHAPRSNTRHD